MTAINTLNDWATGDRNIARITSRSSRTTPKLAGLAPEVVLLIFVSGSVTVFSAVSPFSTLHRCAARSYRLKKAIPIR
jgi:hypothetical protein